MFAALIVAFTFVCNFARIREPFANGVPVFEYMRQRNAFIPEVRPGGDTERYLTRVTARVTLPGALGLALPAAGLTFAILAITGQNVVVLVLSLLVTVQTLADVRSCVEAFRSLESYESLLPKRRLTS